VDEDLAARNERIAFFEARAAVDKADFVSLNVVAWEYLQRARETGDVGDYDRARRAAERSLALLPQSNYDATLAVASLRLIEHDYAAALSLSEQAIAIKPRGAAGFGARGDALLGLGRYDEAASDYQTMVEIEPDLPALSRLAGLAFIQNDRLNAEDFWRQTIESSAGRPVENTAWAHTQLGGYYFSLGEIAGAKSEYEKALGVYPEYAPATAGLAAIQAAEGKLDEAIALYEDVQARRPDLQNVIALADLYTAAGYIEAAQSQRDLIGAIDQLYRANGINTDLSLALYYADHDIEPARALSLAVASYNTAPSVYAADAYAWALYRNGRIDEAKALSEEALRLDTPQASFYYHAGLIAAAGGDNARAVELIEKALALNPYFSPLQAETARETLAALGGGK
jgi:tetratricopeptide (TPR) repeat protein